VPTEPSGSLRVFKVLYPFRGSGWLIAGRSRHRLNTGDVILIPPRVLHRITDSSPLALYIVCIQSEFVKRIPGATIALGRLSQFFQAGFDDLSHFYRVFRTCSNGLTPEAWRRKPGNALVTGTLTAFCNGSDF